MTDKRRRKVSQPVSIESTDRWVAGKDKDELFTDLKVYLERLRDNPRSIVDRLHVAAIQLRLGRVQEALVHYEGVLRGYVADGQIMSAIALGQRILAMYPELPRLQQFLAALYARAPRGSLDTPSAVTPFTDDQEKSYQPDAISINEQRPTIPYDIPFAQDGPDRPPQDPPTLLTQPKDKKSHRVDEDGVILLTKPKKKGPGKR